MLGLCYQQQPTTRTRKSIVLLGLNDGNVVTEDIETHVVNAEIPLLIGWEELELDDSVIEIGKKLLTFRKSGNKFNMRKTIGCHGVIDLAMTDNVIE